MELGDTRSDETDLDGSSSDSAADPCLYSDRQATKSLTPGKSALVGDSAESKNRKEPKIINSFSHALLGGGPQDNDFLVAAKKPASSRQSAESQEKTALSNETLPANPAAAEPLQ